jgi:hypothetical protein
MDRMYWILIVLMIISTYVYIDSIQPHPLCSINVKEPDNPEYLILPNTPQRQMVMDALAKVRNGSESDYQMICKYGSNITIIPLDTLHTKCESTKAMGCYDPSIKMLFISDYVLQQGFLTFVMVHEACHGMRIATANDYSEEPCLKMDAPYRTTGSGNLPPDSKVEAVCQSTREQIYNKERGTSIWRVNGTCQLKNKKDVNVTKCIVIYMEEKSTGNLLNITEACASLGPQGYMNKTFESQVESANEVTAEFFSYEK